MLSSEDPKPEHPFQERTCNQENDSPRGAADDIAGTGRDQTQQRNEMPHLHFRSDTTDRPN